MINSKRVKRIKNLIYAFIILVLFLPLILMSILSFRMIGLAEKMSAQLDEIRASVSSQAVKSNQNAPDGGYVIEPESQSSSRSENAQSSQAQEEKNAETGNETVSPTDSTSSDSKDLQTAGGSGGNAGGDELVGGVPKSGTVTMPVGSGTNSEGGGLLESDGYLTDNTSGVGGGAANPQTGTSNRTQKNLNGNPLTGR